MTRKKEEPDDFRRAQHGYPIDSRESEQTTRIRNTFSDVANRAEKRSWWAIWHNAEVQSLIWGIGRCRLPDLCRNLQDDELRATIGSPRYTNDAIDGCAGRLGAG